MRALLNLTRRCLSSELPRFLLKGADGVASPEIALVPGALFKALAKLQPLMASDDAVLTFGRESVFLSRHCSFAFPRDSPMAQDGVEGMSFKVRAHLPVTTFAFGCQTQNQCAIIS